MGNEGMLKVYLSLVCLSGLLSTIANANKVEHRQEGERFPSCNLLEKQNKRIHISYELVKNNIKLQVEELLDTENWNQLIQFRSLNNGEGQTETILILNGPKKRVITKYKPFECIMRVLDPESGQVIDAESDWTHEGASLEGESTVGSERQKQYNDLIESIVSLDPASPYLAWVPNSSSGQTNETFVVLGTLGLWLRVQYSGEHKITKPCTSQTGGDITAKPSVENNGKLCLDDSKKLIFYRLTESLFDPEWLRKSVEANIKDDPKNFIEVRDEAKNPENIQALINIMKVNFLYDNDELAQRLLSLPIGFNCKTNPNLVAIDGLNFIARVSNSHLAELEIIATNLREEEVSVTKTLTLVDSSHPVDPSILLSMIELHEDGTKIVRDFRRLLMHTISRVGRQKQPQCQIEHLKLSSTTSSPQGKSSPQHQQQRYKRGHQYAKNPVNIQFTNGITLTIDELLLEYIFDAPQNDRESMNYLNRIQIDGSLEEHVFESKVPKLYEHMISLSTDSNQNNSTFTPIGLKMVHSINIVRVYQSKYLVPGSNNVSPLKLARIIMMVFDQERKKKLAELRWNLVRQLQPLSLRRRAKLFDLSQCSNLDENSMQINIKYPVDFVQLKQAQLRSHGVIEDFYRSFSNRHHQDNREEEEEEDGGEAQVDGIGHQRERIASSLNFLRVPKIELLVEENHQENSRDANASGQNASKQIELRLTILDQPAPINFFEHIDGINFLSSFLERLTVSNVELCAKFCNQLHCRMFAYDKSSFECKLSRLSVESDEDENLPRSDADNQVAIRQVQELEPVMKQSSKLYYLPNKDALYHGEASLAEIYSFLEHELFSESTIAINDEHSSETKRDRRSTSITGKTLLSFGLTTNYELDIYDKKLIVPSSFNLANVPLVLDASSENQELRVAKAFSLKFPGKRYQLNAGDNWDDTPSYILTADERTFQQSNGTIYFTLKRLHAIEFDKCAQICYNTELWNFNTSSKQICQSFSYCSFEKQCVLVIETDIGFDDSIVEMGEKVGVIERADVLLKDGAGCVVSSRSNLASFDEPIRLPDGQQQAGATESELFKSNQRLREHSEWIRLESLDLENCAQNCLDRNRLAGFICLAMDYCEEFVGDAEASQRKHCHVFILNDYTQSFGDITEIKSKLSEQNHKSEHAKESKPPDSMSGFCDRFMTSQLMEYEKFKQRSISPKLISKSTLTIDNSSLENCAFECSLQYPNCLSFEYCRPFDAILRSRVNKCLIFDYSKVAYEFINGTDVSTAKGERPKTPPKGTNFNKDCHVYLRKEFKSVEEAATKLLMNMASDKQRDRIEVKTIEQVDHRRLIIVFILIFVPFCVIFGTILKRTLSETGSPATASNPRVPILNNNNNNKRAGTELIDLSVSHFKRQR